jgi:hypothetical protein
LNPSNYRQSAPVKKSLHIERRDLTTNSSKSSHQIGGESSNSRYSIEYAMSGPGPCQAQKGKEKHDIPRKEKQATNILIQGYIYRSDDRFNLQRNDTEML